MISITSRQDGFRRAGMAHPLGETKYPDDSFTDEQLETLEEEPMLVVKRPIDLILGPHSKSRVIAMDKALAMAIACLDPDRSNKADWTRSGMPQVKAMSDIMGEDISAAMRDTAMEKYDAQKEAE